MNIEHMNEGTKADFELVECVLSLGDGEIIIDLAEEQRDIERVISVFANSAAELHLTGETYAAVIIIPPRRYTDEEVTVEIDGEEVIEIVPVPQPCSAEAVTLRLWALPEHPDETENEE